MKYIHILCFMIFTNLCIGQNHDNNWLLGGAIYYPPIDSINGITIMNFEGETLNLTANYWIKMNFSLTATAMSDKEGDLQFYTNGIDIVNKEHEIIENGGGLNTESEIHPNLEFWGNTVRQGAIAIPFPGHPNQYILFTSSPYENVPPIGIAITKLYYSIVDMDKNNGLGAVVLKNELLLDKILNAGKLTLVQHANGRDWWLILANRSSNIYNRILVSPEGVEVLEEQTIGMPIVTGFGQTVFSPDGRFFVNLNMISTAEGHYIEIYDFDRCTGLLSNHRRIHYDEEAYSGGAAIAPNSRYLYIPFFDRVYQYDLWATDIEASRQTVAVYDGFSDPFPALFSICQLAPDGKIYIITPNGINYLHVIDYPDRAGVACNVRQHIELPTVHFRGMPNFPYYRLGPLDGSTCDTLGLNNEPIASFRYERDSIGPFLLHFTDLSYYEPDTWRWDFGDGTSSSERYPSHAYESAGTYKICLSVSNEYADNRYCKSITLDLATSIETVETSDIVIKVYPNPAVDYINIDNPQAISGTFYLYNQLGVLALSRDLWAWQKEEQLSLPVLAKGLYHWEVVSETGRSFAQGKLMITEVVK